MNQHPPQNTPPPCWTEFCAGVTAVLRSWSALKTAVDGAWGGVDSSHKAEFLRETIVGYFSGPQWALQDPLELEDHLAIYMEEEFAVQLEDQSERQVSEVIFQLAHQCLRQQNVTLATQVVAAAIQAQAVTPQLPTPMVQSSEGDDDDDDDDMMMDATTATTSTAGAAVDPAQQVWQAALQQQSTATAATPVALPSAADYIAGPLFGSAAPPPQRAAAPAAPVRQLGESAPAPVAPQQVDDDGFAPVVKRKGRR